MYLSLRNSRIISDLHLDQNDYRFMWETLFDSFMTYTKEKSTDIIASSLNFENFSENVALYLRHW